ncbi:MAG: hypothetical protein JW816_03195 [Candidatus Buchananbacteria bacterium]|nr:hypothetical protein [Candidatus Buchananbacteria bacterium]
MSQKKKQNDFDIETNQTQNQEESLGLVKEILENTQSNIKRALEMLNEKNVDYSNLLASLKNAKAATQGLTQDLDGKERIIEGVFNGEKMIGPDGVEYNVPANYASKSKLVEGDILKLTIAGNGSFIFKQIGPSDRKQLVANLVKDEMTGDWYAVDEKHRWKLLTASVTYFHGQAGDEVVILVPKDGGSSWAAVENVIKVV